VSERVRERVREKVREGSARESARKSVELPRRVGVREMRCKRALLI